MKYLGAAALAVLGTLALSTGASAAIVCNEDGDCWKVKERHKYPPEVKLEHYDDDWKWAEVDPPRYRWREPGVGRGYYKRGGVWINF
jgi:hypothetical protein